MDGAAAEHVREAIPVLAGYADALGIRAFAGGTRPRGRPRRHARSARMAARLPGAADQPRVGDRPSLPGARRLEDARRPRRAGGAASFVLSWANHPKPLPLAVPAAAVHMAARARHGGRRAAARRPTRCREPVMERARGGRGARGGSVRETDDRARGAGGRARASTPSRGPRRALRRRRGGGRAARRPRATGASTSRLVRRRARRSAASCTACRCGATWWSPTRCSTGRAAPSCARRTTGCGRRWRCSTACSEAECRRMKRRSAQRGPREIGRARRHARALPARCSRARPSWSRPAAARCARRARRSRALVEQVDVAPPARHPRRAGARRRAAGERRWRARSAPSRASSAAAGSPTTPALEVGDHGAQRRRQHPASSPPAARSGCRRSGSPASTPA